MKIPSDELFHLIKSLSSQEKRYFKLFAQQTSDDASYLKLFDAIDAFEQYDEKKILTNLNKKGGIKNLERIKNYLQETLLRFLEHHHFNYSIEIQLQRSLQRIEVLCAKRLFDSAKKIITKAEKLAIENESYDYLLIILKWKHHILG